MHSGKSKTDKLNSKGYTLIELIVTISIMSVLVGVSSIGLSLAFSRDASQCATKLNDAIYSLRMDSMSKTGAYYMEIKKSGSDFVAVVNDGTSDVRTEKLSENGRIKSIECHLDDGSGTAIASVDITDANTVKIEFNKSKGNVEKLNGFGFSADGSVSGTYAEGVIVFDISQSRGTRTSTVSLVTSTGKHKVGN